MRRIATSPRRGALLALLVVTASCGGAASDAGTTVAPDPVATTADPGAELAGVAFEVRRDPG